MVRGSVRVWLSCGLVLAGASAGALAGVSSPSIEFVLDGLESWDSKDSLDNRYLTEDSISQAGYEVVTISWELDLTTMGNSYASEAVFVLQDMQGSIIAFFTPGLGDDYAVQDHHYSGTLDLRTLGWETTLSEPGLKLVAFEAFDDFPGQADAVWSGSVWINAPAPGTAALIGLGGLVAARRRR